MFDKQEKLKTIERITAFLRQYYVQEYRTFNRYIDHTNICTTRDVFIGWFTSRPPLLCLKLQESWSKVGHAARLAMLCFT